jgi:hypothetical protein
MEALKFAINLKLALGDGILPVSRHFPHHPGNAR